MYAYLWFECFSLSIKMYDTRLNINVQGKAVMQCFYFLSSRGKKIMIYDIICHVHKCMQLCLFLNYVHVPLKIIHVRQCGNTCNIKEDKKGVWRILLEREREREFSKCFLLAICHFLSFKFITLSFSNERLPSSCSIERENSRYKSSFAI